MTTLDDLLLGLGEFQVRLVRNRMVGSYRVAALPLYVLKVGELGMYGRPGLQEHYQEWLVLYQRLWPMPGEERV